MPKLIRYNSFAELKSAHIPGKGAAMVNDHAHSEFEAFAKSLRHAWIKKQAGKDHGKQPDKQHP